MSDDQHNQDGGPPRHSAPPGDSDYGEGDKTQLVDLDSLRSGRSEPDFAPPPTMNPSRPKPPKPPKPPPSHGDQDAAPEEKTQLFEPPPNFSSEDTDITSSADGGGITSSAPDVGGPGFGAEPAPYDSPSSIGGPPDSSDGSFSSVDNANLGASPPPATGSGKMVIGGDGPAPRPEEATQFINVNDFAEQKQAHFTPEQEQAGYDGNTQFVDINALEASNQAMGGDPIENDRDLNRGYEFGPDDIIRGEITIIRARNALGNPVILKQVWEGAAEQMSTPLRERIAELHELKHPNLMTMNGMFVTDSGMWVELDAPRGHRLSQILGEQGPVDPGQMLEWVDQIAAALQLIHSRQLAYAHLTADTVWIDEAGNAKLEPFDMLRLQDQGNLGDFGPPEMDAPPDQRQLSPATDVYSLAAVAAAAITGLPVRPESLENYEDQELIDRICNGLDQDPSRRPATVDAFIDQLESDEGLDIKIVGAGVFAVMFLAVAALSVVTGGDDEPEPEQQAAAAEQLDEEAIGDTELSDEELAELDEAARQADEQSDKPHDDDDRPEVDLPDTVTDDPRLTVETSFASNPPAGAAAQATDDQLEEWREQAQQAREDGEDASSADRFDYYAEALELYTYIITTQQDPGPEDVDAWHELYTTDTVQEELEEIMEPLEEALLEGRMGTANRRYGRLADLHPDATADTFLSMHNTAEVIELNRVGADEDDDDD